MAKKKERMSKENGMNMEIIRDEIEKMMAGEEMEALSGNSY